MTVEGARRFVQSRPGRAALFLSKCAIAALLLWWLIGSGRLKLATFVQLEWGRALTALIACQLAMLLFPLVRWYVLARAHGLNVGFGRAIHLGLIGYFASIFVPGGLGSDTVRFFGSMKGNPWRKTDIASTLVMDRLLGITALLTIATSFGGLLYLDAPSPVVARILAASGLLTLAFVAGLGAICSSWTLRWLGPLGRMRLVAGISTAFQVYKDHLPAVFAAFVLSACGHAGSFLAAYFGFMSLGFPGKLFETFATTPLVNLSGIIPLTPLGLGVSDSIAATLYPLVGLQGGAEVNMLLRGATVCFSALFGLALLIPGAFRLGAATRGSDAQDAEPVPGIGRH